MHTNSDILKIAKSQLVAYEEQINGIQAEIANLRTFIAMHNKLQNGSGSIEAPVTAKRNKGQIAIRCAIELCEKSAAPVKTKDIYKLMQDRGVTIDSETPIPIVSGYLGSAERLKSIRGKGWVMKE